MLAAVFCAAALVVAACPCRVAADDNPLVIYGDITYRGRSLSAVDVEATNTRTGDTLPGEISSGGYTVTFGGPGHEWEVGDTIHIVARGTGRYAALRAEASYEIADGEPEEIDLELHLMIDASVSYTPEGPRAGENVSFAAAPYRQITNYSWEMGDGTVAYGKNVTYVYRSPGNYTVTLTVAAGAVETSDTATVAVRAADQNDSGNDTGNGSDDGPGGGDEGGGNGMPGFVLAVACVAFLAVVVTRFKRKA